MNKKTFSFLLAASALALSSQNAFGDFSFLKFSLGEETGYSKLQSAGLGMNFSAIGATGNAKNIDLYETRQWGAVGYNYGMGAIEVTCAQYAVFLNDTGLGASAYMFDSTNAPYIGLYRNADGSVGIRGGCENKSVCVVKYAEAVAFSNWLSTGNADTAGMFSLPSADEWHKAAYYDPSKNNGEGGYWKYATGADSITIGDGTLNSDADVFAGVLSIGQNSESWPNADFGKENNWGILGTTGGVEEWTETNQNTQGTRKWVLGGEWSGTAGSKLDNSRVNNVTIATTANDKIGFRLATDNLDGLAYTTLQGLDGSRTFDGGGTDAGRVVIPAGGADGFILTDGTILTITNNKVASTSSTGGGALYVDKGGEFSSAPLKFESDAKIVFSNNVAEGTSYSKGGAVYNAGTVDLRNAAFSGNTALSNYSSSSTAVEAQGGAIYNDATGTFALKNVSFAGNTASGNSTGNNAWGRGGAIYNNNGAVTISGANFSDNSAIGSTTANNKWSYGYGGAIFNASKGTMTISDSEFTGNYAAASSTSYGGAIRNEGNLTLSKTNFTGNYITCTHENRFSQGGAIDVTSNAVLKIDNSVFSENYIAGTSSSGGAINKYGYGQTDIKNSGFSQNYVTGSTAWGSALALSGMSWGNPCVTNIENTTFDGNYAAASGNNNVQAFGGAIYSTDFTTNITNSSFTNNRVAHSADSTNVRGVGGGAIYVWGGTVNIVNNDGVDRTFSGNYAKTGNEYSAASGGFLYLCGNSAASFDIAGSDTLTVGSAAAGTNAAFDSIASSDANATITKKGAGSLVLNADNSGFQGTFDVTDGTLVVGKIEHAKLGGNVVIHEGATLCGIGELTGTTTILAGGSLNPGNSPGEMTFGNLTLASGSIINIEAGDSIVIHGTLKLEGNGAGEKVVINFEHTELPNTPFLSFGNIEGIDNPEEWSDYFEIRGLAPGQSVSFGSGGLTIIPEPSTYAFFAGVALSGSIVFRRFRSKRAN